MTEIADAVRLSPPMADVATRGHSSSSITSNRSHGAVQLDYGFPISNLLRGHVQIFDGYGESMIDYNHKATYIGLGVSLLEWY